MKKTNFICDTCGDDFEDLFKGLGVNVEGRSLFITSTIKTRSHIMYGNEDEVDLCPKCLGMAYALLAYGLGYRG